VCAPALQARRPANQQGRFLLKKRVVALALAAVLALPFGVVPVSAQGGASDLSKACQTEQGRDFVAYIAFLVTREEIEPETTAECTNLVATELRAQNPERFITLYCENFADHRATVGQCIAYFTRLLRSGD
jgi:hypothetical protein